MLEPKPDPMIARDLVGYGEFPPHPAWPGGALIAVNFNLNRSYRNPASTINRRVLGPGRPVIQPSGCAPVSVLKISMARLICSRCPRTPYRR